MTIYAYDPVKVMKHGMFTDPLSVGTVRVVLANDRWVEVQENHDSVYITAEHRLLVRPKADNALVIIPVSPFRALSLTEELIDALGNLTAENRIALMDKIHEEYCQHCGRDTGAHCQCTNDE